MSEVELFGQLLALSSLAGPGAADDEQDLGLFQSDAVKNVFDVDKDRASALFRVKSEKLIFAGVVIIDRGSLSVESVQSPLQDFRFVFLSTQCFGAFLQAIHQFLVGCFKAENGSGWRDLVLKLLALLHVFGETVDDKAIAVVIGSDHGVVDQLKNDVLRDELALAHQSRQLLASRRAAGDFRSEKISGADVGILVLVGDSLALRALSAARASGDEDDGFGMKGRGFEVVLDLKVDVPGDAHLAVVHLVANIDKESFISWSGGYFRRHAGVMMPEFAVLVPSDLLGAVCQLI